MGYEIQTDLGAPLGVNDLRWAGVRSRWSPFIFLGREKGNLALGSVWTKIVYGFLEAFFMAPWTPDTLGSFFGELVNKHRHLLV
jgi:hypothetical protein